MADEGKDVQGGGWKPRFFVREKQRKHGGAQTEMSQAKGCECVCVCVCHGAKLERLLVACKDLVCEEQNLTNNLAKPTIT